MFNSISVPRDVASNTGSRVVVRSKHTEQVASVMLQTQIPNQLLSEISSESHCQWTGGLSHCSEIYQTSEKPKLVIQHVNIQMSPQLSDEATPHIYSPPHQSMKMIPLQSHTRALGVTPAHEPLSAPSLQSPARANDPHPVGEEKSFVSPSSTSNVRAGVQPNSLQSTATSSRPPVLSSGEIHSKAQSMARSRLEKARCHLQGRIQQAIGLFGGEEISLPQVKRKQVALCFIQFGCTSEKIVCTVISVQMLHCAQTHIDSQLSKKSGKKLH